MPNTYVALKTNTVTGSAVASVVFDLTGISGYTDLVLVATGTATALTNLSLRFNGDTTSNYSRTMLYGNGSTATSYRVANYSGIPLGDFDTSQIATHIVNIQNYNNATTFKTVLARWNNNAGTYASLGATASLWRKTPEAITSITIYADSGNLNVGSTFSLYGIANADQGAAKATGGIITEDSQYWYHTFGASGAFIPKQSLTCDILQVAGGGSGGGYAGGGGGAGGLLYYASQSLTATSYNITVGAGAAGGVSSPGNGNPSQFASLTASAGGGYGAIGGGVTTYGSSAGGSGGGGGSSAATIAGSAASPSGQGFAGGNGGGAGGNYVGGGGGGSGAVGETAASQTPVNAPKGGDGLSTYSSWVIATSMGEVVNGVGYIAGGGGGSKSNNATPVETNRSFGGYGGGGRGAVMIFTGASTTDPEPGKVNSGGGGGGGGFVSNSLTCSAGGSGVVIVRYAK